MDQTTVTIDLDLPADLAEEFERCAREEGCMESELFIRMFRYYLTVTRETAVKAPNAAT